MKTDTKHTPGPWIIQVIPPFSSLNVSGTEAWGEVHEIISAPDGTKATSALFVGFVLKSCDANLFSAAPDLLAALEGITKAETTDEAISAYAAARAAIHKARHGSLGAAGAASNPPFDSDSLRA